MEKYLMGIDAGNTSSKVVIFDLYGKMIATAATPSMHFKRRGEGFEEFDVTELWNLISVCIKEAVEKAAVAPEQIAGVGVTSFGNGVVFLDILSNLERMSDHAKNVAECVQEEISSN